MALKRAVAVAAAAMALAVGTLVPASGAQDGGGPPPPPLVGNTTVVTFGQFPAVGYLVADFPSGPSACTATLIRAQWVLTAAHCVQAQDARGFDQHATTVTVYLNLVDANDIFVFPPPPNLETHVAAGWIVHGDYHPLAIFDDVALVKLASPSAVSPMSLATDASLVTAPNGSPRPATAFGFGINLCDPGNCHPADGLLRMGPTEISSDGDAEGFLGMSIPPIVEAQNLFLLPNVNNHGALCFGDSGGPLMVDQGGTPRIAGVNSFIMAETPGFCNANGAGQYLNAVADVVTSDLASWVNQVIDDPSETCWGLVPTIEGTSFSDKIIGTGAVNVFHGKGSGDLILGRSANDHLCGGSGGDVMNGDQGADRIAGNGGDDLVEGSAGADLVLGNSGSDLLLGGENADTIRGGAGPDLIDGEGGNDRLRGGSKADTVLGGPGADDISGGTGGDDLRGHGGADMIDGDKGNDRIRGGSHGDVLEGGSGRDTIRGQGGGDTIEGQVGNDRLRGNRGPDVLDGGAGTDDCRGGAGADTEVNCE